MTGFWPHIVFDDKKVYRLTQPLLMRASTYMMYTVWESHRWSITLKQQKWQSLPAVLCLNLKPFNIVLKLIGCLSLCYCTTCLPSSWRIYGLVLYLFPTTILVSTIHQFISTLKRVVWIWISIMSYEIWNQWLPNDSDQLQWYGIYLL